MSRAVIAKGGTRVLAEDRRFAMELGHRVAVFIEQHRTKAPKLPNVPRFLQLLERHAVSVNAAKRSVGIQHAEILFLAGAAVLIPDAVAHDRAVRIHGIHIARDRDGSIVVRRDPLYLLPLAFIFSV